MAPRDVKLVDGETEARKNRMTYLRSVGAFGGQPASVVSLGATSKSQTLMEGWGEEGERASPSSRALATLFPTWVARGPLELEDLREGSTCACAPAAFPPSFPFRSPLFTGRGEGGGKREERELALANGLAGRGPGPLLPSGAVQ